MTSHENTLIEVPEKEVPAESLRVQLQESDRRIRALENELKKQRSVVRSMKNSLTWKTGRLILSPAFLLYRMIGRIRRGGGWPWDFLTTKLRPAFPLLYPFRPKVSDALEPVNHKVIYTVILGNYDDLKDPLTVQPGWDYICFTDRLDLQSPVWRIIGVKSPAGLSRKRCAEYFHLYPFKFLPKYRLSILIGGQMSIECNLEDFIGENLPEGKSLAIPCHHRRDCIYDEAIRVKELKKDNPVIVDRQMEKYRRQGFPAHFGLVQAGVMIRRHDDARLKRHCKLWLKEVMGNSQRDQLSFNYILWRHRLVEPYFMPKDVFETDFKVHRHNYKQEYLLR